MSPDADVARRPPSGGHIVVTGGGTAGHVLPAIAIMDRLVAAGRDRSTLHYLGARRGIENRLVPPTGYDMAVFDVSGLQRSFAWRDVVRNAAFVPRLARAVWQAWRMLGRWPVGCVVNVGGYASMPATFAARVRRWPVVVVSYDQRPGLASRVAARFATATAAAFADSPLPRAHTTGAPLRPAIIAVDRQRDREAARAELDLPADRFVVAVFGGSLGAKAINEVVAELVRRWAARSEMCVYHVVGDRWLADPPPEDHGAAGIMYRVVGFEERMPALYAAADLLITRAGASTIAELAATGAPAIVVPWPDAADDHQTANARTLSDVGAAVLVDQRDLTVDRLASEIERLAGDPEALAAIGEAAWHDGERHRSSSLIDVIEDVAR